MKIYTNEFGHKTKMATMPVYMVKTFKILLLQNPWTDSLGTWYVAFVPKYYKTVQMMTLG